MSNKIIKDDTGQEMIEVLAAQSGETVLDNLFSLKVTDGCDIDTYFKRWWALANNGSYTRTQLLSRWFKLMNSDKVFGEKDPIFSNSQSSIGELTDDSIELGVCSPSTNTVKGTDNFANQIAFWIVEVEYEIGDDGEIIIMRVDKVDSDYTRKGLHGMVGVAQKTAYIQDYDDGKYNYLRYSTKLQKGYVPLEECVAVNGTLREFAVRPKYGGGYDINGIPTSATDKAPMNYNISESSQISIWRKRGANYSGGSFCDLKFREIMFRLKYARKGNSGLMEGCSSYNFQYAVALGEAGVERVVLTTAQAANFLVGSNVIVGNYAGSTDRNNSGMYSICKNKKISKIVNETIDGTEYGVVYIDNGGVSFDTVANGSGVTGTTYISSMPYWSGWCDNVLGNDGTPYSNTSGKEPFIIQGLETQMGAYAVCADVICKRVYDADAGTNKYEFWACREAKNITTSITENYYKVGELDISNLTSNNWYYIGDTNHGYGIYARAVGNGAGSSNGCRCATYLIGTNTNGNYEYLAWAALYSGGGCGLACSDLDLGLTIANWDIAALACGSGANRGEFKA